MSTLITLRTCIPPPQIGAGASMPKCLETHLAYLRQLGLANTTIYQRARHLTRLKQFLGDMPLEKATPDDLARWRASLTTGPEATCAYIWHVKDFYRYLVKTHKIRKDPSVRLEYPKTGWRLPRPISEADVMYVVACAPPRIRPWLVLAGWAGLRAKEIAYLRRPNVLDTARPPILIVATDATKGRRERTVPMSDFVVAEIVPLLPASGFVFPRNDGQHGPNQPWTVSHLANRHLHECGINATLHQLRHRFGTAAYQASRDLRVVQELMGHQSPSTTAGYAAFDNESALAAVQALPAPGRLRVVGKPQ